jgi:putative ABC transport system permease protein
MVSFGEDFKIAFDNLKRRKIRSFLTILAIVVGMTAVVMFITLGMGLQNGINKQFQMMGADKLWVVPSSSIMDFGGTTSKLTDKDIDTIEKVAGVKRTTKMVYGLGKMAFDDQEKYAFVIGMPPGEGVDLIESMQGFKLEDGRFSKNAEDNNVVVGWSYTHGKFFDKPIKIGNKVQIEGKEFKVIGSLTQVGSSTDDAQVYITLDAAQEMFNKKDQYDYILVQVLEGVNTSSIAEKIKDDLRKERDVDKGSEDFTVQTSEELTSSFNAVLGILFIAVVGIASISLLVGGVGVMNTMYTSVLDRTREIGVMKAIGATNHDIMTIFVMESGLLGLVGGIFGLVLGISFSYVVEFVTVNYLLTTLLRVYIDIPILMGILLFSFAIGCISGFLPARRAASMKPVDALRYE